MQAADQPPPKDWTHPQKKPASLMPPSAFHNSLQKKRQSTKLQYLQQHIMFVYLMTNAFYPKTLLTRDKGIH